MKKFVLWFMPLLILLSCTVEPPFEDLEIVDHIKIKGSSRYLEFGNNGDAWLQNGGGVKVFDEDLNMSYIDLFDTLLGSGANKIALDSQDRLWFDNLYQLKCYKDGEIITYSVNDSLGWNGGFLRSLSIDSNDNIWMIYQEYTYDSLKSTVVLFDQTDIHLFNRKNTGILSDTLSFIKLDSEDNIWVVAGDSLFKYNGTEWTCYDSEDFGFQVRSIQDLAIDQDGNICAAVNSLRFNKINKLMIYNPNRTLIYNIPETRTPSLFIDSDNMLWYADRSSLITFDGNVFRDVDYDFPPRFVNQAPNGDIWSVTDNGIYIYRKNK
jgi:ligand-binding sensor domain-containing protein